MLTIQLLHGITVTAKRPPTRNAAAGRSVRRSDAATEDAALFRHLAVGRATIRPPIMGRRQRGNPRPQPRKRRSTRLRPQSWRSSVTSATTSPASPATRRGTALITGTRAASSLATSNPETHPLAGHPAGLDCGVDLPLSERAHPGGRAGPARAQAISLSPALARGPRQVEIRQDVDLRPGPSVDPRTGRGRSEAARVAARAGARRRGPADGGDALPHRQHRIRQGKQELWADHPA